MQPPKASTLVCGCFFYLDKFVILVCECLLVRILLLILLPDRTKQGALTAGQLEGQG